MSKKYTKKYIEQIILSALSQSDCYGYEIAKAIKDNTDSDFELKQPTLYNYLKRLQASKQISYYWGEESNGGRRKYYEITEKGALALQNGEISTTFTDAEKIRRIIYDNSAGAANSKRRNIMSINEHKNFQLQLDSLAENKAENKNFETKGPSVDYTGKPQTDELQNPSQNETVYGGGRAGAAQMNDDLSVHAGTGDFQAMDALNQAENPADISYGVAASQKNDENIDDSIGSIGSGSDGFEPQTPYEIAGAARKDLSPTPQAGSIDAWEGYDKDPAYAEPSEHQAAADHPNTESQNFCQDGLTGEVPPRSAPLSTQEFYAVFEEKFESKIKAKSASRQDPRQNEKENNYKHIINDLVGGQLDDESLRREDKRRTEPPQKFSDPNLSALEKTAEKFAERGIKLSFYNKESSSYKPQAMLYQNKINFASSWLAYVTLVAEILLVWLLASSILPFGAALPYLLAPLAVPAALSVVYIINPTRKRKPVFKFKYHFVNSWILFGLLAIMIFAVNVLLLRIVFTDTAAVVKQIALPLLTALSIPTYVLYYNAIYKKMLV